MRITRGFLQESTSIAAWHYHNEGFNVLPLWGKKPALKSWKRLQFERVQSSWITAWERRGMFGNVGIICGKVSGNVVVIDLDGIDAVQEYERRFPRLLKTLTVATGSGQGAHLYYIDQDTRTVRMKGFEVRGDGCYVVAPPSLHPQTGQPYRLKQFHPVMQADLSPVRDWIAAQKLPRPSPTARQNKRTIGGGFAARALQYEVRDVAAAGVGNRNNRLNRAAYNLGQLVGDDLLTRSEVESALLAAATSNGSPEREALATITSGLDAGIQEPRSHQWQKRR